MIHEEDAHQRPYDHRLMRRLLGYVGRYRRDVLLAGGLVVLESLVGLAGPAITKQAIDHGIRHQNLVFLNEMAMVYFATLVVAFGLGVLQFRVVQRVGQRVMRDLRHDLFAHLQRLPVSFYDGHPIGRLMTRVTHDVDTLNELVTAGVAALFGDLVAVLGIMIAMSSLNVELLAVTFSVLPAIAVVTLVFRSRIRRSFREVRTRLAAMNAFLNENLGGMSTVQQLNREGRHFDRFREVNAAHRDANLSAVYYHALFFPIMDLVGAAAVSLIIWYGGRQVMWTGITLGTLVAFIQYAQRFFRPISDLSEKYGVLQQAMASSERIFRLLDTPPDPAAARLDGDRGAGAPAVAAAQPPFRGHVEFERVWFAYRDEHWVLEDVSFAIQPGEKVAIVGSTGAGKTTLAHLLYRFYAPQRGRILVDGRPLEEWDAAALRGHLGLVLQDVFLFSGTIGGNLALGDGSVDPERLARAAREVHADRFIEALPGGYDAPVVERGATLSAGQRQLLAFARAVARDPALLILDEATSSVDSETEGMIQDALQRMLAGRTAMVIAHRLSTIQNVDRIVVLHHGRVRETGTHEQLLALGGLYARLHQLQALGGRPGRPEPRLPAGDEEGGVPVIDTGFGLP